MCLPHNLLASIFQVIDKIEHAVNTTIIEYYGQADKKKFTEAVDKAQQEVRENLDKVSCREKTKNYSTLEKILFFSPSTQAARRTKLEFSRQCQTYDLLVTSADALLADLQDTRGDKTSCILRYNEFSHHTYPLYREGDTRGKREPSPLTCLRCEPR